MAKDTYYFSHDSNARNDIKIVRLRRALGMEGYGIYFALIEILREQHNYMLPLTAISDIAFDLHSSEEKVKAVVASYDLFFVEDSQFFSARLLRSMEEFNTKRQKYIDAGKKGGEASVKHRLSIGQPLKVKDIKEKDIKENKSKEFTPPSFDDFLNYFIENNQTKELAIKAFKYYEAGSWRDSNNKKVLNWKSKVMNNWFSETPAIEEQISDKPKRVY